MATMRNYEIMIYINYEYGNRISPSSSYSVTRRCVGDRLLRLVTSSVNGLVSFHCNDVFVVFLIQHVGAKLKFLKICIFVVGLF